MEDSEAEAGRLQALNRLRVLDTECEPPFNRIVLLAARLFNVPHAAIHLIDDERQWVKAFHGSSFECPRDQSSCQYTIGGDDVIVVPDMTEDARFRNLPGVTGPEGIRFYAGSPLRTADGYNVGSLCILDTRTRDPLSDPEREQLRDLATIVIEAMELRLRHYFASEALQSATEVDPVTGLRNRASLVNSMQRRIGDCSPACESGVLNVRIDRMDLVQGASGEVGCNAVMREASARLQRIIDDADLLGRGDGKALIVARAGDNAPSEGASTIRGWVETRGKQILDCIAEPFQVDAGVVHLSASIGVATGEGAAVDAYALLDSADTVASLIQQAGGSGLRYAEEEVSGRFRRRLSLESRLRAAVRTGDFSLVYQPIVDLQDGCRTNGAESLVRWIPPDQEPCPPDVFIPLAEELGLIGELGQWVIHHAVTEHVRRRGRTWPDWIAINLSPYQLHAEGFVRRTEDTVRAAGVDPQEICFEITESAIEADFDEIRGVLADLGGIGFSMALDDFGTGHSSLARVIQLPFTRLKIDRGFVNDCPNGPGAAVVSSLAQLTESLGMQGVAEGVETIDHERYLMSRGIRYAQGFRYARPMSAGDLAASMSSR